ncbi:WYL domain-containing protein [bacterium]|nr:WYL domain-containing protein [bacterium]
MDSVKNKSEQQNSLWMSTTGYRILLLLRVLIQKSCTVDELVDVVSNNPYVNKYASKDTIRMDINTLKAAGCVITRPSKANNYKYELLKHPFVFSLSDSELQTLINVRELLAKNLTIDEIFVLNTLYSKIINLTFDEDKIDFIKNSSPLINIDKEIYNELSNPNILNKKLLIKYKSPKFGEEKFYIIPLKILYENEKVYLQCFNYKYNSVGLLNVERILKIESIDIHTNSDMPMIYDVVYEVSNIRNKDFKLNDNEIILEQIENKIIIKAKVENEFIFVQRLLQLGTNFRIISPDFLKEKLVNKIKQIQKVYE